MKREADVTGVLIVFMVAALMLIALCGCEPTAPPQAVPAWRLQGIAHLPGCSYIRGIGWVCST